MNLVLSGSVSSRTSASKRERWLSPRNTTGNSIGTCPAASWGQSERAQSGAQGMGGAGGGCAHERDVARVDLQAEEVEELDERCAGLHALVGERDEGVSRALLEEVDLVVVAKLAEIV